MRSLVLLFVVSAVAHVGTPDVREGDLVFQTSTSPQSEAIRLATHSRFSHVGLVVRHDGQLMVLEAVQPVRYTKLAEWIRRGEQHRVVVRRMKSALSDAQLAALRKEGQKFVGRDYDLSFAWSDDRLYCSELVYKVYRDALHLELSPLKKLRDFDLSAPIVAAAIAQRYGKKPPLDEQVVSPEDLFESPALTTVYDGG